MDAAVIPRSKTSMLFTKISAGVGSLLGVLWGLFTYVFPDPSVFGINLEFLNWRTMIALVSVVTFLIAFWIAFLANKLPRPLKYTVWLLLSLMLCGVFFKLGSEYAKPSFEFARGQKLIQENDSSNVFGKRVETVDDVRIELQECEQNGQAPTCTLVLTNNTSDRNFRLVSPSSLFEEAGGALNLAQLRVGDAKFDRWDSFQLIRNVPTRLTLIFEATKARVKVSPALKLTFRNRDSNESVLKFNEVKVN
ncbi:hypothetical protein [Pseudomonas syringae]|uniref:Uncharacterized protein n=1 Tax=Pseudomonas syringae TaxID=317 RepID=A0A085VFG8_PSESX|nr:hypothetical protein [Pseudomonas syringae]KFE54181.1 hypothetical protein IV01_17355 [Pseudomonas syringae]